jgi:hypothetical protein
MTLVVVIVIFERNSLCKSIKRLVFCYCPYKYPLCTPSTLYPSRYTGGFSFEYHGDDQELYNKPNANRMVVLCKRTILKNSDSMLS